MYEWIKASFKKQAKNKDHVTEFEVIPDRGHSLTIDDGWKELADAVLEWLHANGM